jgi:hypothetical protein
VPVANICTVLFVLPVWILGVAGPTVIDDSVGFTKNPRQLAPSAIIASTANAPVSRTVCFFEGMLVVTPWARTQRRSGT